MRMHMQHAHAQAHAHAHVHVHARLLQPLSQAATSPYRRLSAPPLEAAIAMRDATEVRIGDNLQYMQP